MSETDYDFMARALAAQRVQRAYQAAADALDFFAFRLTVADDAGLLDWDDQAHWCGSLLDRIVDVMPVDDVCDDPHCMDCYGVLAEDPIIPGRSVEGPERAPEPS